MTTHDQHDDPAGTSGRDAVPAAAADHADRRVSRRQLLAGGVAVVSVVAAGVGIGVKATETPHSGGSGDPTSRPDLESDSALPQPIVRWSFAEGIEGWQTSSASAAATVEHDRSGWLVVTGSGTIEAESARGPLPRPMDWNDLRDTARRLSATVRVDGGADSYPVTITMCFQTRGSTEVETVTSAAFKVPSGRDVDLDTWWDCRGAAPSDVLQRVQGVRVGVDAGSDRVQLRIKNVRQPPSTVPYGAAAYGLATIFHAAAPGGLPVAAAADAYQQSVLSKLTTVDAWRRTNNRAVHIGEWGWPKENRDDDATSDSDASFAGLAEQWMRQCDQLAIPYTPWGESAYWGGSRTDFGSYPLANFYCSGKTGSTGSGSGASKIVDTLKPSAERLVSHLNAVPGIVPSINLVGMCFVYLKDGSEYSSTNIGKRGSDYFTENAATVKALHDRGYRMFRLPFRWDRVMRTPDGELDAEEWGYVKAGIETILSLPDTSVIVDEHSSATFWISPNPEDRSVPAEQHVVDDPDGRVTVDNFVNFWSLVSADLRAMKDRLIYEITNEPHNSSPFAVKRYTQAVVSALRAAGDDTFCLIPSHPYDNITTAFDESNQPFPWIEDPAGSRRHAYTLHHYMDYDQSGAYALTYDQTLAKYR